MTLTFVFFVLSRSEKQVKQKLTADLKKKILRQHKENLKKCKADTELYEIGTDKNKKDKIINHNAIFHKKNVRTVLMTGVAGVGKTSQTRRFMVDWAKGNSNTNIDLIVPLPFRELKSRKDTVQSMKDLLCQCLSDNIYERLCKYEDCKILFVLDDLEECTLPLDFEKNEDLTDKEQKASMDVLLTNLIKGKLLPSSLLWIISQPSGVTKIPSEYFRKVTECRG